MNAKEIKQIRYSWNIYGIWAVQICFKTFILAVFLLDT